MESNKDEAFRCIELATSEYESGNKDKAERLLLKSMRMFSTPKAEQVYISFFGKKPNLSKPPSRSDPNGAEKPYTEEQQKECKRIANLVNYYEIMQITQTATKKEIKQSYRKLAMMVHPDKNKAPDAENAFKKVSAAYSCLVDPEKRKKYDLGEIEGESGGLRRRTQTENMQFFFFEEDVDSDLIFREFFGTNFFIPNQRMRRNRSHHHQRSQSQAEAVPDPAFSVNIFISIIIFCFALLILSGFLSKSAHSQRNTQLFSLNYSSHYTVRLVTRKSGVTYWVPSKFDYTRRSEVERLAEKEQLAIYVQLCKQESPWKPKNKSVHCKKAEELKSKM